MQQRTRYELMKKLCEPGTGQFYKKKNAKNEKPNKQFS